MFGANPNISHYAVGVRYLTRDAEGTREGHTASRDRRRAERERLKAAGLKTTTYFQYRNDDSAGKARAKKLADKESARITKLSGVTMEVAEGCFL
jgi:hypothetical protein